MEAVAEIKTTKAEREQAFAELYELAFPVVARWISKMVGSFADAKDLFQDALVIWFEKSRQPEFELCTTTEAYLLGIAKHLWLRKFRNERGVVSLSDLEREIQLPDDYFPTPDNLRLLALLERTGRKCLDLLRAFYYEQLPMKEIAGAFGFRHERSATVQKYKCLEKVRNTVKEKAFGYEDFLN